MRGKCGIEKGCRALGMASETVIPPPQKKKKEEEVMENNPYLSPLKEMHTQTHSCTVSHTRILIFVFDIARHNDLEFCFASNFPSVLFPVPPSI